MVVKDSSDVFLKLLNLILSLCQGFLLKLCLGYLFV